MTASPIELHAITRMFGAFTALHDVSLALPPGRIGLLGPNGAGKSTLLKILLGLLPPSSGSGRLLGHDLASAVGTLRRAIGYMPETADLVPGLTGSAYLALADELSRM